MDSRRIDLIVIAFGVAGVASTVVTALVWPEWLGWYDENGEYVESSRGWRLVVHLVIATVLVIGVAWRRDTLTVVGGTALVIAVLWSATERWLIEQQSDSQVLATTGRDAWRVAAALLAGAVVFDLLSRRRRRSRRGARR